MRVRETGVGGPEGGAREAVAAFQSAPHNIRLWNVMSEPSSSCHSSKSDTATTCRRKLGMLLFWDSDIIYLNNIHMY